MTDQSINKTDTSLSIVVPMHNAETTISRLIESADSLLRSGVFFIIVDDGSSDNSVSIVSEYMDKYANICCIHQDNLGASEARNTGLSHVTTEWVMFADADDTLLLQRVSDLISCTDGIDIYVGNYVVSNGASHTPFSVFSHQRSRVSGIDLAILALNTDSGHPDSFFWESTGSICAKSCWAKAYRRSFLLDNKIRFDPSLTISEDTRFNIECYTHCRQIELVDRPVYSYTVAGASITRVDSAASYYAVRQAIISISDYIEASGLTELRPSLSTYSAYEIIARIRLSISSGTDYSTIRDRVVELLSSTCLSNQLMSFLDGRRGSASLRDRWWVLLIRTLTRGQFAITYLLLQCKLFVGRSHGEK